MFNVDGMHVLDVRHGYRKLVITVETDAEVTGCPTLWRRRGWAWPAPSGRGGRAVFRRVGTDHLVEAGLALRRVGLRGRVVVSKSMS